MKYKILTQEHIKYIQDIIIENNNYRLENNRLLSEIDDMSDILKEQRREIARLNHLLENKIKTFSQFNS
jgi:predicted nuclease with TOPRIM domain